MYGVKGLRIVLKGFKIEAYGTEAVVAADHGAHGVLHPAVEEVALATSQGLHEGPHHIPGGRAQARRALTVDGDPLLSDADVAGVLDGVLILRHQVVIDGLAHSGNADLIHRR